jgi:hypothetical protein
LLGTFSYGESQLVKFNADLFTKDEVQKSLNDLKAVNEACFGNTKKLSPGIYSLCFKYLSDKYGVQSIEAINNFNKKLWPGAKILATHKLSEEMLQKVMSELPAQPWPGKIHQQVLR